MNILIVIAWLIGACLPIGEEKNPLEKYRISASELSEWVNYLSSDRMKGRANGSPEMAEAERWIAGKFREFGILAFSPYPDYLQPYEINLRGKSVKENNVIGYIPGSDPLLKDQYIIISAHFDHVGIRRVSEGDSIFNGADDNAAGTCTMLGIARTISENKIKPGRTLVFAAFSGEEMGLRGSGYFVKQSPVDLERVYANLNYEMTGHSEELGPGNYYMTGCGNSNLDEIIKNLEKGSRFTLIDTLSISERLFYMSDNASFARRTVADGVSEGIPCGTFATTTMAPHIHSPADEARFFDFENMASLVDNFAGTVILLSNCKDPVVWTNPAFRSIGSR